MHPSADRRNVLRTLMAYLVAASLGVAVLPASDVRAPTDTAWVRVSVQDVTATAAGRVATRRAVRHEVLVTAECWVPSLALASSGSVDAIDGLSSQVAGVLCFRSLPLKDYVKDSTGATLIADTSLRNIAPPVEITPAPVEGFQRRTVQARMYWFAKES